MNHVRKIFAFAVALFMAFAVALPAFAQTVGTEGEGKGSITINNAAKGEKYGVIKIFDAKLSDDKTGISYTTDNIPDALSGCFKKDSTGNIIKQDNVTDDQIKAAVQNYASSLNPTMTESDGTSLTFQGLDYGYYAVKSTQGTTVTIDSTTPNVTIYDKNTKDITVEKKVNGNKSASYSIGDTVNYTAEFLTVNFYGIGEDAKQVTKYTITDTLPDFLSNVAIDSVVVTKKDGTTTQETFTNKSFNANGSFDIVWADEVPGTDPKQWTSKYDNGAKIIVTYHGTLTSVTNINKPDKNTVKIQPTVVKDDGTPDDKQPWNDSWQDSAEITTYGAALQKVDGSTNAALKGAKFKVKGLSVEAVKNESGVDVPGVYKVASYNATDDTLGTEMSTDDNGRLYIIGLASNVELDATETQAPNGYNKVDASIIIKPKVLSQTIYETSGTKYYDADGNLVSESTNSSTNETVKANLTLLDDDAVVVQNNKGTEMPSTGGIGTTIFYVVGGVMVAGAVVFLLTKRRVNAE